MENLKKFCEENKYTLKDRIDFNIDRYGDGIPSVTTVMKLIVDHGFEYIKNKYGKEVEAACIRGTKVHKDAEDYARGLSRTQHKMITKFQVLHNVSIEATELRYVKGGIQGTIDVVGAIDGIPFNIDYKNTLHQSAKYFLQLGGYKYLNGRDGMLLMLDEKKYKAVYPDDKFDYEKVFMELKDYFFKLLQQGH